jgi:hypothetical protein
MVICSDVIEHIINPDILIDYFDGSNIARTPKANSLD